MCGGECGVKRCTGCPGTDWSAFTWQWDAPASPGYLEINEGAFRRFFLANSRRMFYPGVCPCLWLAGGNDRGIDILGTYNTAGVDYPIPSIGSLQYRRTGSGGRWIIQLSRWSYYWGWSVDDAAYYGYGWGWDDDAIDAGEDCDGRYGFGYGRYWGGYGGYGYGGWGWAYGGGYAYNYGFYGSLGTLYSVTYSIPAESAMDCQGGTTRFFLNYPTTEEGWENFDAAAWPAFIDITRVQK